MADSTDKEFYKVNKLYSVTLNPVDQSQFLGKLDRYKKFHTRIYNVLMDVGCKYDLYIEISEPRSTKNKEMFLQGYAGPRLHLHGIIQFTTRKMLQKFLLQGFYKITRISSLAIDHIDNLEQWHKYCTKQHILPVSRHIYNKKLFPTLEKKKEEESKITQLE